MGRVLEIAISQKLSFQYKPNLADLLQTFSELEWYHWFYIKFFQGCYNRVFNSQQFLLTYIFNAFFMGNQRKADSATTRPRTKMRSPELRLICAFPLSRGLILKYLINVNSIYYSKVWILSTCVLFYKNVDCIKVIFIYKIEPKNPTFSKICRPTLQ